MISDFYSHTIFYPFSGVVEKAVCTQAYALIQTLPLTFNVFSLARCCPSDMLDPANIPQIYLSTHYKHIL